MNYQLKPHQQEAIDFSQGKNRICLAMKMRTGKTLTSLHIMLVEKKVERLIIICPVGVIEEWKRQLKEFFDIQPLEIRTREEAQEIERHKGIVITTPKLATDLKKKRYDGVIIDEAHKMKGGEQFEALKMVCDLADYVIAMSGTPAVNRPKDLYSIFRLCQHDCAFLKGAECYGKAEKMMYSFLGRFCYAGTVRTKGGRNIKQYTALKNESQLHSCMSDCFFLYFGEIKEIREEREEIVLSLNKEQKAKYDTVWEDYLTRIGKTAETVSMNKLIAKATIEIQMLRQIISRVKADKIIEMFRSDYKEEKAIIFAHFIETQQYLKDNIENSIIFKKPEDLEEWKRTPNAHLIMGARKGVGIELTEARTVIFCDREWNYKDTLQAEARIKGINQKADSIKIITLTAKDTIDEYVEDVNKDKRQQLDITLKL